MKNSIYDINTLHDLLNYNARKIASAEKQVESILPLWIEKANAIHLKNEFHHYLGLVKQHVQKLLGFLRDEGIDDLSRTSNVMAALIIETKERLFDCTNRELTDASLLSGTQEIVHYKISLYGALAAFAKQIANNNAAHLFHEALLDEKEIDVKLSGIAEQEINSLASATIRLTAKS